MSAFSGRAAVYRQKKVLEGTFERGKSLGYEQLEMGADLARLLCVMTSGWLEASTWELARDLCQRQLVGPGKSYALAQLDRTKNPSSDSLVNLVACFDESWRSRLEAFLTLERKAAINSVVGLRNDIAHGTWSGTSSLSLGRISGYYALVAEVVDELVDIFDPLPPTASVV